MKVCAHPFGEAHALKCELAAEALRSSGTLKLQVTGWSMLPSIWPGDTLMVESVDRHAVSEGDMVLFARDRRLFAHRVVANHSGDGRLLTRGDAMPAPDLPISDGELLGKVSRILRNGRWHEPSRRLRFTERAVAALVRGSEIGARVVVGLHGVQQASLE
jgi:signal peptidase I